MKLLQSAKLFFDDIDRHIIRRLHGDSRTSIRTLAAEVGLSAPGCSERLKRRPASAAAMPVSADCQHRVAASG